METSQPTPLRHVVIGVGAGVFGIHSRALELETVDLVAVCDVNEEIGRQRAGQLGIPFYQDYQTMLTETQPDVAVIMTPHPFHAPIAIDCLQAGCHVLVEKPIAVHVAEADAMIEAAARANRLLAVNFQFRFRPEVRAARRLIQEGHLGQIQHIDMVAAWTRTAAYYAMGGWRATWAGEGGGVLMNQAPHNLDLLCFLMDQPSRVVAWTRTQLHQIETEDTVQAIMEWPEGTLGSLHISTAEAGRPERLEIVGTGGYLQLGRGGLTFRRFEPDLRDHIVQNPHPFSTPEILEEPVELEEGHGDHVAVYRNFHAAILHGTPLGADGIEGRKSLELANGMIYASFTHSEVEFPLDRAKYVELLESLKAQAPKV